MTAGTTQFYGLTKLDPGEAFSTNDQAFTRADRDAMDRLLYQAITHAHTGTAVDVSDPDTALEVTLSTTGGNIPAGTTVRYKYAWVDAYGAESAASPEVTVNTPAAVGIPNAPAITLTASGGSLLQGNYFYRLSAYVDANTNETQAGDGIYTTIPSGTANILTLTLPTLPYGADGFNVYRRAPGETAYSYLASIDMTVATPPSEYEDDGSVSPNCNRVPSNVNTTNSSNSVDITLPGATPTVPTDYTWKIYRTYAAGDWESSLIHWVVEETTEGSGIITPEYTDVGGARYSGAPKDTSELAAQPAKIDLTDAANIQGTLPPNMVPQLHEVTFAYPGQLYAETGTFQYIFNWYQAEIIDVTATLGIGSSPAAQAVIVDVNKYDAQLATPVWDTIFTTQSRRPQIAVGEDTAVSGTPNDGTLYAGDRLSMDIDQTGQGATPTDSDLTVIVRMWVLVEDPATNTSYTFS